MILVLVGVEDVCALVVEQAGDARYQALLVGAVDQQNGAAVAILSRRYWLVLRHRLQIT